MKTSRLFIFTSRLLLSAAFVLSSALIPCTSAARVSPSVYPVAVPALRKNSVTLASPRNSQLATLFARLQREAKGSPGHEASLEQLFAALKGPVFRSDMNEVDGVASRYRTAITKMNQDNGAEVIRALYLAQPVLREYVEEAQGVAVIDDANPPLYLRLNRLLKKYRDLADPVAEIKKQDPVAAEKILALDKALDALPRVKGIVFRGGTVSKQDAALMRSGKLSLYSVAPFWSTSSNFKDATGFAVRSGGADREQTVFIIQTQNGKFPTPTLDPQDPNYSPFVLEEEVLLPRGTRFDVVAAASRSLFDPDADPPLLYVFLNERSERR